MNPRNPACLLFLAALAVTCAGCVSAPTPPQPVGKAIIEVQPDVRPTKANAQPANEVVIILPPAQPGQVWRITQHNADTLHQLTDIKPATDGSGNFTVSFMAMHSANTRLLFALVPTAGGAGIAPTDIREIQIRIE